MAISLPLSKALMSIVPGVLMVNWLAEGQFAAKFRLLKERKSLLLLLSVFVVYLVGMLWTDSLKWGLNDVKIQLPLFVLPLVIGTSGKLKSGEIKSIIYVFSGAVIVASLCSIATLLGLTGKTIADPREMSLFISHIRFALMINIAIFSMGWYLFHPETKRRNEKLLLLMAIVWLTLFLAILKSATGLVVFVAVLLAIVVRNLFRMKKMRWKMALLATLLVVFLVPVGYIGYVVNAFYNIEPIPENISSQKTSLGNLYYNDFENKQVENGHYTFSYISGDELREAWTRRTNWKLDTVTSSGYNQYVLLRYMTSKGLRKDADGIAQLTDADIANIKNGMTNYRFANPMSPYQKVYQIVWESYNYQHGGNPAGHSVTQRLEYYKMAFNIIRTSPWFGQGTGGYFNAYQKQYDQNEFFKDRQQYRQRSHNMFLSYWIDFGIVGLVYICFAMARPVFIERKTKSYLMFVFLLIVVLSCFNEDTLNNHDAVSFFAFFFPLYLYSEYETGKPNSNQPKE